MKVLVCGASGCVGNAVVQALRSRGHRVIEGGRALQDGRATIHIDFAQPREPVQWAKALTVLQVEAVVNCAGVLIETRTERFERVHSAGPIELFRGAVLAGVRRIVQVSALGVGSDTARLATPYLHSKLRADDALAALPLAWAVLRPSLVVGPRSQSVALFATLASLPVIALPGRGAQPLQPVHVFEVAEAVARLVEDPRGTCGVFEMGGALPLSYRDMLQSYRTALRLGPALWLALPMPLMALGARLAEWLPQRVFSRDTLALLARGNVPQANASEALLGRAPSSLAQGLAITPPTPLIDLRAELGAPLALLLRASLAFLWLHTALISAVWPQASGLLNLLARCGLSGGMGQAALIGTCTLNLALGLLTLVRPSAQLYAVQIGAILAYTLAAAVAMPELTIDHCGALVKNLPLLVLVLVLWLAHGARPLPASRRGGAASSATPSAARSAPAASTSRRLLAS